MDRTVHNADDDDDLDEFDLLSLTPTAETYRTFNEAFDCFNNALFGGDLPDALITMQRNRGSRGYFAAQRFAHRRGTGIIDEIALNPAAMQERSDKEVASTLVHEMVHLWQHHFGKPSRRAYHNREWAAKMESLGLMPSDTGQPGGRRTGQRVTHYIIDGGPFDREWQLLAAAGFKFEWHDRLTNGPDRTKDKVHYTCPSCALRLWGKPGAHPVCGDCGQPMPEG